MSWRLLRAPSLPDRWQWYAAGQLYLRQHGSAGRVQVGSGASTAPRYDYVYDARGDVVNLTDTNGNVVASYAYDTWGNLTSASESLPTANGWVNPYRFDGRDGVRYDAATGLDWMAVRAYDPSVGRFLSRDPLGRAPLFFANNPYVYAGNNPLSNVDPSGQYRAAGFGSQVHESWKATKKMMARVVSHRGTPSNSPSRVCVPTGGAKACEVHQSTCDNACKAGFAQTDATNARLWFEGLMAASAIASAVVGAIIALLALEAVADYASGILAPLGLAVNAVQAQLGVLVAGFVLVGALAGWLMYQFDAEASKPASWWTNANFTSFSSPVMSVMRNLQTLATTLMFVVSGLVNSGGPIAGIVVANFGVLGLTATAFAGVNAAYGEADETFRAQASLFGWAYSY